MYTFLGLENIEPLSPAQSEVLFDGYVHEVVVDGTEDQALVKDNGNEVVCSNIQIFDDI